MRAPALVLLVAAPLAACAHTLSIPQPGAGGPGAPLPALTSSRIDVPFTADLRATLRALDAQVPTTLGTNGEFRSVGPFPAGVRYTVRRAPFRFEARGAVLHAETTLELTAEACVGAAPLGIAIPFFGGACQPVGSCGVGEAPRRVVVATNTTVRLDPAWRLVAVTEAEAPRALDRCELTPFRIDVSGFVAGVVAQEVTAATARLDEDISSRGNLRSFGERLWRELNTPVDLGEGFWLSLAPEGVHTGSLVFDGESLRSNVGFTARPHVIAGARPQPVASALPPLEARGAGEAGPFRVTFDATVGFDEVTRLAGEQFRGRTLTLEGHRVLVQGLRASASGSALMFHVDVRFEDGAFQGQSGTVTMAGLPDYDRARDEIVVRELDYTLETRSALLDFGEWFLRSSLRSQVAAQARFPMGDRVARLRVSAERALTRELGPGARMSGRLATVVPVGTFVTDAGLTLRVTAEGSASVTQDAEALGLTGARQQR